MAETLEVLIKLAERRVEEAQRNLSMTRQMLEGIAAEMVRLEQEAAVAFVSAVAEDDVLSLQASGAFQERIRREVARLREMQARLTEQEAAQRELLQAEFAAQKRFELLLQKQKMAEARAHAKKVQAGLDEVAARLRRDKR